LSSSLQYICLLEYVLKVEKVTRNPRRARYSLCTQKAGITKNYCETISGLPEVLPMAHIVQILNWVHGLT
jgi:hypothetical protein